MRSTSRGSLRLVSSCGTSMICPECETIHIYRGKICAICRIKLNRERHAQKYPLGTTTNRGSKKQGRRLPTREQDILFYYDSGISVRNLSFYLSVDIDTARMVICENAQCTENKRDQKRRAAQCMYGVIDFRKRI